MKIEDFSKPLLGIIPAHSRERGTSDFRRGISTGVLQLIILAVVSVTLALVILLVLTPPSVPKPQYP